MTMIEPSLPEPLSREESDRIFAATDPESCTCGHEGLPSGYHRDWCSLSMRVHVNAPRHRADVEPEEGPIAKCCGECATYKVCGEFIRI